MPDHQEKCSNLHSGGSRLRARDVAPTALLERTATRDWVNFVTVKLADFAAQSKELESSDFEEIRVKSETGLDRRESVLTTSRRLRVDGFRVRAHVRTSPRRMAGICIF